MLDAAAELGYRPNLVARSLVERRTRTLGVLVNDLHNPFHAEVVDGLHESAHERGLRLVLGTGRRDPAAGDRGARVVPGTRTSTG